MSQSLVVQQPPLLVMHSSPQRLCVLSQVKSHFEPSHVASAWSGVAQGLQLVPHAVTLVFATQLFEQS